MTRAIVNRDSCVSSQITCFAGRPNGHDYWIAKQQLATTGNFTVRAVKSLFFYFTKVNYVQPNLELALIPIFF